MKTLIGAVTGVLAFGAVLVSYDLGARHASAQYIQNAAALPAGMAQPGQPGLVQAGYMVPAAPGTPMGYATYAPIAAAPGVYAVPATQVVTERVVTPAAPVVRRASQTREYVTEPAAITHKRSWQKSVLLIGGSAAGGAGVGAVVAGKKGAGIGALLGGGAAAIYDQVKRH